MNQLKATLRELLFTSRLIVDRYVSDLSCHELLQRPGKIGNPVLWQLGHLIASEIEMLQLIGLPFDGQITNEFLSRHQKGAYSDGWELEIDREDGHQSYLQLMKEVRAHTLNVLDAITLEEFGSPAPEKMRSYAQSKGSIFSMIASHECLHAGQIAVLRRELGKPVVL